MREEAIAFDREEEIVRRFCPPCLNARPLQRIEGNLDRVENVTGELHFAFLQMTPRQPR
jgi:hypothetical protein